MLDTALRPARARPGAIWDLFLRAASELPPRATTPEPEPATTAHVHTVEPARAAAHAAYAEVVGGGPRALDAALAVVEADLRRARLQALQQEEALKLLRLYATDQWARSVAERALEPAPEPTPEPGLNALTACLPRTLHDPDLAEGRPCSCGDHR
jgi:hypothetical protein